MIDKPITLPTLALTSEEETDVMKLAAVGFMEREIAAALELKDERLATFLYLAAIPESQVANLIAAGRAHGRSVPQIKLQEAAEAGNIDAIKTLQKLQARNRFNELVNYMDDDEFAP